MDLLTVNTELLLEEIKTDGHAPLKFICDTGDIYYCKYLKTMNRAELNCLAYEVVANYLLNNVKIPTPEIALVKVAGGTLNNEIIIYNRRLKTGNVCFGSRNVKYSTELQSLEQDIKKKDFNNIVNPQDIIKIACFDLWVLNADRGKFTDKGEINYNLLLAPHEKRQKIIAFDHSFIFGGIQNIGTFNPRLGVSSRNMLLSTPYYQNIVRYLGEEKIRSILEEFLSLLPDFDQACLVKLIRKLEHYWDLSLNLDKRIIALLTDKRHLKACRELMFDSIKK